MKKKEQKQANPWEKSRPRRLEQIKPTGIGSMKGTIKTLGDIVSPASDEDEWEVLRD